MDLATLDEEVLDDIDEDPEGDEPQAETRRIELQRSGHVVECLAPLTRETLETGRVPAEPMDQVRGQDTNETLGTHAHDVQASDFGTPEKPWRSSIQFVEEGSEEIDWLIPGVLPKGAIVLLSGREGTMKSFLALSMAHAVASGISWLGRPTKPGPALYVDGEMPKAFMQDRLRGFGTVQDLHIWSWTDPEFPYQLNNPALKRAAREHSLIVIDTSRRHMDGLKENSADDMAKVTKDLRELTRYGATVLVVHHAPKDIDKEDYRGSTELGAGVDITLPLTMKPAKAGAMLTLGSKKTRCKGDRLEIEAREGPSVPVLTIRGDQETSKNGLSELVLLVNEMRNDLGRDPNKTEIKAKAKKTGLGGRSSIDRMLNEGEGTYWRIQKDGRDTRYAPA